MFALPIFQGREAIRAPPVADSENERVAAVEKIEDQRKPDDFFGHRNRTSIVLP